MSSALDELVDGLEPATEVASLSFAKEPSLFLSLDVGTSGVRAALFDDHANEICGVKIGRRVKSNSDFAELNPADLVAEVVQSIDQLLVESAGIGAPVQWIAISTFWHSLLGIDATGKPTTPLLTWADTRATSIAKTLRSQFNEGDIHRRTGCRFHSSYWPAKLLWLKQEAGKAFKQTTHWLGFAEYLCRRLFGNLSASISMASATGLFNQRNCDWDWEFVRALEISPVTLPPISRAMENPLEEEFKSRWPTLADAKLITVVGDGAANNIGGGCSSRDKCALMVGTSGALRVVFEGEPPSTLPPSLWSYRIDNRRVVIGGALSDGGGLYQWLTNSLLVEENPIEFQKQLAAIEPDSHGLTMLPFWSGERSTGWSGDARGAILGLTQQTKPVEIVRAALEAIAYRFALITRALESVTSNASIVATGNALRSSPVWLQIIADVLGKPVTFGGSPEASIRGAALLALEAVGKIGSIEDVPVSVDEVFEPDMSRHVRYQQAIERQEEFYRKLV
jgi:gluconokinase